MLRFRWWCLSSHKHYQICFCVSTSVIIFITIYSFLKILNAPNQYEPQPFIDRHPTVNTQHDLLSNSEFRKKIFERKIEKLAELVKKKPRIIAINNTTLKPNYNVHVFYYAWYGNMKYDNEYFHWNHDFLPNWRVDDSNSYPKGHHQAPIDIGSNYYPVLGCYSARDPLVIETHVKQIKESGIGVIILSWSPPGFKDSPHDMLPTLFHFASMYGIKISLHVEPYKGRNPINLREHLLAFFELYGNHPSLYKVRKTTSSKPLPLIYIYDSYLISINAWREFLSKKSRWSIRDTNIDAIYIGLLVDINHRYHIKKSKFDGFYTYFATNGFSYGSSWKNWMTLSKFAKQNDLIFIPSVGPGYIDTQVRPWNNANTRFRRHGQYYDVAWRSAVSSRTKFVSITSWNEWHEGTQIEPAKSYTNPNFKYLDYEPDGSNFYLNLTKFWVGKFAKGDIS